MGQGIAADAYDRPLFDGKSAKVVLGEQISNEKADKFIKLYEAFVPTLIDDGDEITLASRDFFMGVKDAEAVRTRATTAMELVADHIERDPLLADRTNLVSASLACGAAGPVYENGQKLRSTRS